MSLRDRRPPRIAVLHLDPVHRDGLVRLLFQSLFHRISFRALCLRRTNGKGATECVFLVVWQLRVVFVCAHHGTSIAASPPKDGAGQRVYRAPKTGLREQRLVKRCAAADNATCLLHRGPDRVQEFDLGLVSRAEALADFDEAENAGTIFFVNGEILVRNRTWEELTVHRA